MLWCRFEQCWCTFAMLLVQGLSERGFFRHFSDHVFGVCNFGNTKSVRVTFFLKMFKTSSRFRKCSNIEKCFCFRNNCISIGIVQLSLLRTVYFSSTSNVFASRPKIRHVYKRDVFQLN